MRLIHCADLHLDSRMNSNLDPIKAKERQRELLHTYERMVAFAAKKKITAILIAGDLFDTRTVSATTRNVVLGAIRENPQIHFYYLRGNHDIESFFGESDLLPENLFLFGKDWITYEEADGFLSVSGVELSSANSSGIYDALVLDSRKFNLVLLHGQEIRSGQKEEAEVVHLNRLRNKGIDYLALGHIHSYKAEKLDARGTYCYPGCLEGRGFDETGEHGFVLLDIDEENGTITQTFLPFAKRKLWEVEVDVTDAQTTSNLILLVEDALEQSPCSSEDLVKVSLIGTVDVECEKNCSYIQERFQNSFYYFKIVDETGLRIDPQQYLMEESLKGEFVRLVLEDAQLPDEEKNQIIRLGLKALSGEEVEEA